MQGKKTHEQQLRILERRSDVPSPHQAGPQNQQDVQPPRPAHQHVRATEFPVSRTGMHQESRDHNKHNHQTQDGHKPQQLGPANEKH
jgi:hypothetical protein